MIDLLKIPTFTYDEIEKILGDPNSEYNQNPSVRVMLSHRMAELVGGANATPTVKAPKQPKAKTTSASLPNFDFAQALSDLAKIKNLNPQEIQAIQIIFGTYSKNVDRHYQLSLLGLTNKEIQSLTQAPIPSIARDIWKKKKGN
jgi:hypothetical protein